MDYLIQGDTLSEIADAIRGKTGNQAAIAVKNMASQIDSIQAGGGGSGDLDSLIAGTITEILGSNAMNVRPSAFNGLDSLVTAEFMVVRNIYDYAFYGCSGLEALIIRTSDAICNLASTTAFYGSGIESTGNGHIYVPDAMVYAYRSQTNWSNYASKIRPLSEYTGGA